MGKEYGISSKEPMGYLPINSEDEKDLLIAGLEALRLYYEEAINRNPDMKLRPFMHRRSDISRELLFRIRAVQLPDEIHWSKADD